MNKTVAFQGEHGAYSEQAVLLHFGKSVETKPSKTLQQVFSLVEQGTAEYGVVPAENSLEGSVNLTYDLLLESNLKISCEIKIRIDHCLLALAGTKLEDLSVVYSHPQALAQCSKFLEALGVETTPTYDTAGSAKMINEQQLRNAGAIANERSAEIYGLTVLRRRVEDSGENYTRFFIIDLEDAPPSGNDKTSVVFGTKHVPGSLHRALGELAVRKINLTRIESRPIKTTPWEYHFFVDFEGHRSDSSCAAALEALGRSTTLLRVLGSYPRAS